MGILSDILYFPDDPLKKINTIDSKYIQSPPDSSLFWEESWETWMDTNI